MKLHKNLFDDTEDNSEFLLYLYRNPKFTVQQICDKYGFKYQTFFNHLTKWEYQEFIISERQSPELGKIKYKYFLSQKAIEKLFSIKKIWDRFIRD